MTPFAPPPNSPQSALLDSIRQGFNSGRMAHAFLVVGPKTAALRFATDVIAMIYCTDDARRPCRECPACRRADSRDHPDALWIEPQKKSRTIQKEQIEILQLHMGQTSFEGGWKVVILVDADRMNEVSANRILKTLEEPPARSLFLLLTAQPEALLPTVISRCQRVVLASQTFDDNPEIRQAMVEILAERQPPTLLNGMIRARRFIRLLKDLREQVDQETDDSAEFDWDNLDAKGKEEAEDILAARVDSRYRELRQAALGWLLLWQRDLLLCVCGLSDDAFQFTDQAAAIRDHAAALTYGTALHNIRVVERMKDWLERSLQESMVFERGFATLQ